MKSTVQPLRTSCRSRASRSQASRRFFLRPTVNFFLLIIALSSLASCTDSEDGIIADDRLSDFYAVENIEMPVGLTQEVGGMDFMPNGKLVAVFHRGEVMLYDPVEKSWELFAEGLHDPLGVRVLNNREILVMQRPELTKLIDVNQDGVVDEYRTVTDAFGMSGNYHEFAFGPVADAEGNLYFSLNCASNGAGIWEEVRGPFNPLGRPGRMYSCVPYRGYVMKLTPEGELIPWANGFRSPDGLGFGLEGDLFVTDNQGDWLGTSKLYHVEQDKFYGHPSSLVWQADWNVDPLTLPVSTLDSMRTRAAVLFPHNVMANSPTQPVAIPRDIKFGPFAGQLLVGEMDNPRIMRIMLEKVKGEYQGACVDFLDSTGLSIGNHRMAFAPDGSLWVGKSAYVWVGDKGIQRITYQGGVPMDVLHMNVTPQGFDFTFTRPVDTRAATNPANYHFQRYYYEYHQKYGSPQMDVAPVPIEDVHISEDGKKVSVTLSELKSGYVYDVQLDSLKSEEGVLLKNNRLFYTLNNLP